MHRRHRILLIAALLLLISGVALAQGFGFGFGLSDVRGGKLGPAASPNLLLIGGGNILLIGGGKLQCITAC